MLIGSNKIQDVMRTDSLIRRYIYSPPAEMMVNNKIFFTVSYRQNTESKEE